MYGRGASELERRSDKRERIVRTPHGMSSSVAVAVRTRPLPWCTFVGWWTTPSLPTP